MSSLNTAISAAEGVQAVNPELAAEMKIPETLSDLKSDFAQVSGMKTFDTPPPPPEPAATTSTDTGGTA